MDVQVISVGIGPITVADVEQASTSGQRILAFNVGNAHSSVTQQVLPGLPSGWALPAGIAGALGRESATVDQARLSRCKPWAASCQKHGHGKQQWPLWAAVLAQGDWQAHPVCCCLLAATGTAVSHVG